METRKFILLGIKQERAQSGPLARYLDRKTKDLLPEETGLLLAMTPPPHGTDTRCHGPLQCSNTLTYAMHTLTFL